MHFLWYFCDHNQIREAFGRMQMLHVNKTKINRKAIPLQYDKINTNLRQYKNIVVERYRSNNLFPFINFSEVYTDKFI